MFNYLNNKEQLDKALTIYEKSLAAPFYKKLYSEFKRPEDIDEWRALPLLKRQDIVNNTFPHNRDMLTCPLESMIVISTGGTSGVARYTVYTHEEWDLFCENQAEVLRRFGVLPGDRVANLFIAGHMWPSFLGGHDTIKLADAVHLPISSNIPPEEIFNLCIEFDVTVMLSLPTLFIFLADLAIKHKKKIPSLRLIVYAGEHMSNEAQKHIKEALGVKQIRAGAYTSADAGLMGYECDHCSPGVYHIPTDFQLLEIIHADTGKPAEQGEEGEIVVTNLGRNSFPIIRYLIGDVGTFIDKPCPCGDQNPIFKLGGRSGEDFKLGGGFISMKVFNEVLGSFGSDISLNYTLEIEDRENKVIIILYVESPEPEKAKVLQEKVRDKFLDFIKEFKVGLERDYIEKFDVEFVDLGTLPRNPRTGKIKHLNDKRINK